MSGGSWDYLCYKDIEDLATTSPSGCGHVSGSWVDVLDAMAQRLEREGAPDAADATRDVRDRVIELRDRAHGSLESGLTNIWRAVEWVDSCDSGPEAIAESVAQWRVDRAKEQANDAVRARMAPAVGDLTVQSMAAVRAIASGASDDIDQTLADLERVVAMARERLALVMEDEP